MRIGEFSDTFYPVVDGVGRVVLNYANTLSRMGHECYVITPMVDTGYRGGYPFELIDFCGTSVPGSPQYRQGPAILDRHYSERMASVKLDIVHAHTPFFAGQEALRIATRHEIPLVATFHSKYYDDFYKVTKAELLANIGVKYVVEFYEHCDEVWAVSKASAEVLDAYGYRGDVHVIGNGTEIREQRACDLRSVKERFNLGAEPILLFVGQLNWKKNIRNILEACALLKGQGQPFRLVLAGQGQDERAIREKGNELAIGDDMLFTGHITDNALLDGLYQAASLFVFPSIYDTAGLVLQEAAVMGTPAILTRGSAAAEAVVDGVNGFLSDNTPESLASVIRANLADAEKLRRVGEAARRDVPQSWDRILVDVERRYNSLVENFSVGDARRRRTLLHTRRFERQRGVKG